MYYTFQDKENLYLLMNYISGGNLRYHLTMNTTFTEPQTSKYYLYILFSFRIFYILFTYRFRIYL